MGRIYKMNALTTEEISWVRLSRTKSIGAVSFWRLIQRFGNAQKAIESFPHIQIPDVTEACVPSQSAILHELKALAKVGGQLITGLSPYYPARLKAIADPPPTLSCLGHAEFAALDGIAIVGGRNASLVGQNFCKQIAQGLCHGGHSIISGLARGIDGAAHIGALEASGKTVAVLAGGVNVIYPREHTSLYNRIQEHGLILSEMPFDTPPTATLFPKRNRIISGLSKAVVVIEASLKSGSLITARTALEQGRDVMAVPGFPTDSRHHGCNHLIRQGAPMVESADDVMELLGTFPSLIQAKSCQGTALAVLEGQTFDDIPQEETASVQHQLLDFLSPSPLHVDELIRSSKLSAQVVQATLLDLELQGMICRSAGHFISRLAS